MAELIPHGSRVADVGTDHAILPRWLLATGRAVRCVACDLDPAALERARSGAAAGFAADVLDLRHGDGLATLRPEDGIDVLVLAGLGAAAISAILGSGGLPYPGVRRLVLQPQSEVARLRRDLLDRGYAIVDERLVRERGRFYAVIAAEPRKAARLPARRGLTGDDVLAAGPVLLRSGGPVVREYWEKRLARLEGIAAGAKAARPASAAASAAQARRILRALGAPTSEPDGRIPASAGRPRGAPRSRRRGAP